MKHGRSSQIIPVILIVVIVVVSVAAIVALARTVFFNDNKAQDTEQQDAAVTALLSTSADRGVRMTVRGNITADEEFRSYQIVVTPTKRDMTTYAGYLDSPIDTVQYDNNTKAYEEFVFALNRAEMMAGQPLEGKADDTRGLCAGGKILEFETIQNDQTVRRLWTSTCGNAKGSLRANSSTLGDLFMGQIPAGQDLLKKIHKS